MQYARFSLWLAALQRVYNKGFTATKIRGWKIKPQSNINGDASVPRGCMALIMCWLYEWTKQCDVILETCKLRDVSEIIKYIMLMWFILCIYFVISHLHIMVNCMIT